MLPGGRWSLCPHFGLGLVGTHYRNIKTCTYPSPSTRPSCLGGIQHVWRHADRPKECHRSLRCAFSGSFICRYHNQFFLSDTTLLHHDVWVVHIFRLPSNEVDICCLYRPYALQLH